MLKSILMKMRADEAFMLATLVATGYLDVNSSDERKAAVVAEMHSDLDAAGIDAPIAPAPESIVADTK